MRLILIILILAFNVGCMSNKRMDTFENASDSSDQKQQLFIFFDGSLNKRQDKTNIRRIFNIIKEDNKTNVKALYIEGVGTDGSSFLGNSIGFILGFGMEHRMRRGYTFLSEHYNPDDEIYIFGFSRGALQARALAGFISYAGLMNRGDGKGMVPVDKMWSTSNKLIELTKQRKSDPAHWLGWNKEDYTFPLNDEIANGNLSLNNVQANIEFLGIWDTVPGSAFKEYYAGKCVEGGGGGTRYKTDSYPPIKRIYHAVSLDEKRSRFKPLIVCEAIGENIVSQIGFAGSHSDVGGGYSENEAGGLPAISRFWMLDNLKSTYNPVNLSLFEKPANYAALNYSLAHDSLCIFPGNIKSSCYTRNLDIEKHDSVKAREFRGVESMTYEKNEGGIWLEHRSCRYPVDCKERGGKSCAREKHYCINTE